MKEEGLLLIERELLSVDRIVAELKINVTPSGWASSFAGPSLIYNASSSLLLNFSSFFNVFFFSFYCFAAFLIAALAAFAVYYL